MSKFDKIAMYLDAKQGEMLSLLSTLVNIDSGTDFKAGLNQVASVIIPVLEELGFDTTRVVQDTNGDHVIGRKRGFSEKRLLCLGHLDTVFPEGEARKRPFRLEGEKAFGPGVIDMKGGIVLLLFSLYALMETDSDFYNRLNLVVQFNSDEEIGSPTSRPFTIQHAKMSDAVCVFEPARPGGEVVIERKGVGRYFLNIYGKAAHAGSQPELGISAIEELARKILEMHSITDFRSGVTVNVGVIKGGSRPNIIADQAYAEVDVRVMDSKQINLIEKQFSRICQSHREGIHIELTGGIDVPPMLKTKRTNELLNLVQEAGREFGFDIEELSSGGGSDANHASYHAPTIDGLGPQGTGAHTAHEVLFIPSLLERSKIFAAFLSKWERYFSPKKNYPNQLPDL